MSKSVSIKKSIPVSETGSKAVFKIRNAILSTVVISLMSSVAWADSSVQKLSLQQAIEKTAQYQQSQGVWQTQQKINDANIVMLKNGLNKRHIKVISQHKNNLEKFMTNSPFHKS